MGPRLAASSSRFLFLLCTLFCGLLLLTGNAGAQTFSHDNYPAGLGGTAINHADFNKDGVQDLVVANNGTPDVSIALGNSNGTLRAVHGYSTGAAAADIAIGDFNKDGNLDIAVAHFTASSVGILLGNGDGTFHAGATIALPNYATSIATADFNGNGNLDLAVSVGQSSTVHIYPGVGNGSFGAPISVNAGSAPIENLRAADFNNDGKADLAVVECCSSGGYSGKVIVLLGAGNFGFTQTYSQSFVGARELTIADVNQDGYPDMLFSQAWCSTGFCPAVNVLLSQGNGQFTQSAKISLSGSRYRIPFTPQALDVNGDGIQDIAFAIDGIETVSNGTYDTYEVLVYLGNPDGSYQSTPTKIWTGTDKSTSALTVADFNRDGKLDLATANPGDATNSVLLNTTARAACRLSGASPSVTVCQPQNDAYSLAAMRVQAGTTDSNTVTSTKVYVDNVLKFSAARGSVNTTLSLSTGPHALAVKSSDSAGHTFRSTRRVNIFSGTPGKTCGVALLSARLCLPGSSSATSVRVVGGVNSDRPVTALRVYADGAQVYSTNNSDHVDRTFTLAAGQHTVSIKGWDASGRVFTASRIVSVQ